jgi:Acyl-CoA reductase (LuxC)
VATDRDALIEAVGEQAALWSDPAFPDRAQAVERTLLLDNTFTEEAIAFAVNQQVALATPEGLREWLRGRRISRAMDIAVLNPGNVPFVEFQDVLAVVLTGHRYLGALSSRSPYLLPAFIAGVAARVATLPVRFVTFAAAVQNAEAVIASGDAATVEQIAVVCESNSIGPQFRLLRGHRFGVAILDGQETEDELEAVAEDALMHEGRGCRNVAIIWAPAGYAPDALLEARCVRLYYTPWKCHMRMATTFPF